MVRKTQRRVRILLYPSCNTPILDQFPLIEFLAIKQSKSLDMVLFPIKSFLGLPLFLNSQTSTYQTKGSPHIIYIFNLSFEFNNDTLTPTPFLLSPFYPTFLLILISTHSLTTLVMTPCSNFHPFPINLPKYSQFSYSHIYNSNQHQKNN